MTELISTGNDLVAFHAVNIDRTRQERFYSKILSLDELEGYWLNHSSSLAFENFVWLIWSVKESVYKFSKRNHPALTYSVKKMSCRLISGPSKKHLSSFGTGQTEDIALKKEDCFCCLVKTDSGLYYARSKMYNDLIHTVVNDTEKFDNVWWGIKHIDCGDPLYQSKSVRAFVLQKLKHLWPDSELCISDSQIGYPILRINGTEMNIPISFSHHYQYAAYSFVIPNKLLLEKQCGILNR